MKTFLTSIFFKYNQNDEEKVDKMVRISITQGEKRNAYRILVRNPEGNRHLGKSRCRWEDNNMMDLREIGLGDMDWIYLAQDRDQ
jgi:hypothetical protein